MSDVHQEFTPPLPPAVVNVLNKTHLCYLATTEDLQPHLSLMRFSILSLRSGIDQPDDDLAIIISTKKATKKFSAISSNPQVAVLIHDFDGLRREPNSLPSEAGCNLSVEDDRHYSRGTYSVTIYGEAEVVLEGTELHSRCLSTHLAANSAYSQFIVGEGVALLIIRPRLARICNIMDNVEQWHRSSTSSK